mmetsp:Transcript_57569/g.182333  ORF Transcript_57569/g.182333 Transcript_57569/m.182333 type:complete len:209 (+) Transcript_57569:65-691(+)
MRDPRWPSGYDSSMAHTFFPPDPSYSLLACPHHSPASGAPPRQGGVCRRGGGKVRDNWGGGFTNDGVGDDEEALGAEGELVHPPEVEVPFLKRLEERLISHEVRELTLAHRDVLAARVGVEVPLADLRDEARESIAEVALAEIERVQGAEGTGSQEQSHSGEWGELCLGNHAGGTSRTRGGGDAPGHLSSEEARAAGNRGGHGAGGSS